MKPLHIMNKLFLMLLSVCFIFGAVSLIPAHANGNVFEKKPESAANLGLKAGELLDNFIQLTKKNVGNNIGAIGDIDKIAKTASKTSDGISRLFRADAAIEHFGKHNSEVMTALNKAAYNLKDYMIDANSIINNGQYVKELNAYVKIIGGTGEAKAGFVGLTQDGKYLTTFHIKTVKEIARKAPSLGWEI